MMKLTNAEQIPGTDVDLVLQIVHQAEVNRIITVFKTTKNKECGKKGRYIQTLKVLTHCQSML
jgi:hypothetical protein